MKISIFALTLLVFGSPSKGQAAELEPCKYLATLEAMESSLVYFYSAYDADQGRPARAVVSVKSVQLIENRKITTDRSLQTYQVMIEGLSGYFQVQTEQKSILVSDEGRTEFQTRCSKLSVLRLGQDE